MCLWGHHDLLGAMSSARDINSADGHQHTYQYVGPYRLEKTLGKGQTGMNYKWQVW